MKRINEIIQQFKGQYQNLDRRARVMLGGVMVAGLLLFLGLAFYKAPSPVQGRVKEIPAGRAARKDSGSYFLGDEIDEKAYVGRLEAQYFTVTQKHQALSARLDDVAGKMNDMARSQAQLVQAISELEQRLKDAAMKMVDAGIYAAGQPTVVSSSLDIRKYQLDVININPVKVRDDRMVYLPAGSFVRATLLTGVYAPADIANPLPVLIRLNEAFTGPNETRIPLEGAFAIGKASGDLTSERALVQITAISAVLPTGETFEHMGNIGYLTDASGQLGMKGVVVRNTGGQMAMSFMTGFMGGASQALADAQTTMVATESGHTARHVTGSRGKNAAFQGLAQSAGQMSKYYQDQLEKIVPAIKVDAGLDIYLIILEGVQVYGLKKNSLRTAGYSD